MWTRTPTRAGARLWAVSAANIIIFCYLGLVHISFSVNEELCSECGHDIVCCSDLVHISLDVNEELCFSSGVAPSLRPISKYNPNIALQFQSKILFLVPESSKQCFRDLRRRIGSDCRSIESEVVAFFAALLHSMSEVLWTIFHHFDVLLLQPIGNDVDVLFLPNL